MTPEEEAVKFMTFQVALKASDGWVLASDTRAYDPYPMRVRDGSKVAPTLSPVSKIVYRPDLSLIYAISGGNNLAQQAGTLLENKIKSVLDVSTRRQLLTEAGGEAMIAQPTKGSGGGLLIIFLAPSPEIWTLDVGSSAVQRPEFGFGGAGNLAMYFVQRLYRQRSVNELTLLAAYSVLEAAYCNPSVVDGLEMYWSHDGVIHQATALELQNLRERSALLQMRMSELFLSGSGTQGKASSEPTPRS
jgi:hypothetical protein